VARFIHTADWHLGRLLAGMRLTDDQAFVLDRLVELVRDVRPEAVLVAGDIYDRAVPPPEAVALLDETLTRLVETGTSVVVIAGNHDSPERIGFGSRLLARSGVHMAGPIGAEPVSCLVDAADGPVRVWMLPYADPAVVRCELGDDTLRGHDEAVGALLDRVRAAFAHGERNVLLGHEFVAGGVETTDSERPLTVGGTAQVARERFDGFEYVALGHLHRPQALGGDAVRYAGSLLKYSVSEAAHAKSVSVVELGAAGQSLLVEQVSLPARRDVRIVTGELATLVASAPRDARDDYVQAVLTDSGPLYDPMGELRSVYPNCIGFTRERVAEGHDRTGPDAASVRSLDTVTLFSGFFEMVTGEPIAEAERAEFVELVDGAGAGADREA
jgi:DNA repair protein SbcD/Mre11